MKVAHAREHAMIGKLALHFYQETPTAGAARDAAGKRRPDILDFLPSIGFGRGQTARTLIVLVLCLLLWPVFDRLGDLRTIAPFVSAWYPQFALFVVALAYARRWALPLPLVGSAVSSILGDPTPLYEQLIVPAISTPAYGLPVLCLSRSFSTVPRDKQRHNAARFLFAALLLGPIVSALLLTLVLERSVPLPLLGELALGNAISIISVAPLVMILMPGNLRRTLSILGISPLLPGTLTEFLFATGLLVSAVIASLSPGLLGFRGTVSYLYISFIPAAWLAFRFRFQGAAIANGTITIVALFLFAVFDFPGFALFKIEPFIITINAMNLLIAASAFLLARARELHRRDQELMLQAIATSSLIVTRIDDNGTFIDDPVKLAQALGFSRSPHTVAELLNPTDAMAFERGLQTLTRAGSDSSRLLLLMRRSGGERVWFSAHLIASDTAHSGMHYVMLLDDVSKQQAEQERLRVTAFVDPVTGLFNERYLNEHLAETSGREFALILCHFSQLQALLPALGSTAVDAAAKLIATRLASTAHDSMVCRIGFEDFAVVVPSADAAQSAVVAQSLLAEMAAPFDIGTTRMSMSPNIGVATVKGTPDETQSSLRRAASAAYASVPLGTGIIRHQTAALEDAAHRLQMLARLSQAASTREFDVFFQPIVAIDGDTHRISGMEALLRWFPESGQAIEPSDFILLLEQSELIEDVGLRVIREAARVSKDWTVEGAASDVSVNVSLRQFLNRRFTDEVLQVLEEVDFDPKRLIVELTETVATTDAHRALEIIGALKRHGIRFAIDDFGVGSSSLARLLEMDVYSVKIDRQFITGIATDRKQQAFLSSIVALTRAAGVASVAEGVETVEELEIVKRSGCNAVQGFLFAKPMPADRMEALLRTGIAL